MKKFINKFYVEIMIALIFIALMFAYPVIRVLII